MIVTELDRTNSDTLSMTILEDSTLCVRINTDDEICVSINEKEGCHKVDGITGDGPCYVLLITDCALLLVGDTSQRIVRIAFSNRKVNFVPLNRLDSDDEDYFRQRFELLESGALFVYESGLIRFDKELLVVWEVKHKRIDWFFECVQDGRAIYSSEHEGRWGYDITTGARMV